jgi:hypothetical protein
MTKDKCKICQGNRGGVPGNENVLVTEGIHCILCDYCHADLLTWSETRTQKAVDLKDQENARLRKALQEIMDSMKGHNEILRCWRRRWNE